MHIFFSFVLKSLESHSVPTTVYLVIINYKTTKLSYKDIKIQSGGCRIERTLALRHPATKRYNYSQPLGKESGALLLLL